MRPTPPAGPAVAARMAGGRFCRVGFVAGVAVALILEAPSRAAAPKPVEFHVASDGRDTHPGTPTRPFATLQRAQQAVRAWNSAPAPPLVPVTVWIHGGIYRPAEPLQFTPADSGRAGAPITYAATPGEPAVVDGGRRILGWSTGPDGTWFVDLPEVRTGGWSFRQLFVNGESRPRARLPDRGFYRVAGSPEGNASAPDGRPNQSFQYAPGDLDPEWTNLQDVEVIVYHFWTDTHLPIRSIDTHSNRVTFAHPARRAFTDDFTPHGARYVVENVFEGMDQPGEWYLNRRSGRLYYRPRPGERLGSVEIIAPVLPSLLRVVGQPETGRPVEHLRFRDLVFQHTGFELPPGDANDFQGAVTVPGAIALRGASACRFERCEFRNLGTFAFDLGEGCTDNVLSGNELHHLAAGGVRVTGGVESHPALRTGRNEITDNHLHHYGEVYPSATGILLMHTAGNRVAHNTIDHGWYTAVSVGWVWGYWPSVSRDNRVEYNHIHDIGQGLLSDLAGIYTLGVAPGTVLRNNRIHHIDAHNYGGCGIYADEGSSHVLIESNVVYSTKTAPLTIHYARDLIVRNNLFALGGQEQISRLIREPHPTVLFENNIVYWRTGELYSGDWSDQPYRLYVTPHAGQREAPMTRSFRCDWNLYFNPHLDRDTVRWAGATWAEWQARGLDTHSVYANPRFVDPVMYDFRLEDDSPARGLGFRPIDLSEVGPRGPVGPSR